MWIGSGLPATQAVSPCFVPRSAFSAAIFKAHASHSPGIDLPMIEDYDEQRQGPMVGMKLSHYRVVEQVGAGGMGVVYRAHDEQLERDVALKVLPAGMLADETARRRFRKEALALAKLNHPNVATVHEFGSQDDTDFLVTEYIPGVTLDDKLANGALPSKEVVRLGIQLAQGLSAAHDQGIVHRDLKPANLRLTPDGRLKILDFGLAQLMPLRAGLNLTATLTTSQEITGTLPYMAPEQLRGEATDARTDIWAAGAVLFEMATGRRPFPESNGPLLINAILTRDPEPPTKLNRQVSLGLENVILKALEKDPARRYQSVRELEVDLERLTAGVSPLAKPGRRLLSPSTIAGAAIVLLAVALSGYFFFFRLHRGKRAESAVSAPIKQRPSIAVMGFKNLAGRPDLAWLSTAFSEMLTTELAAGEQLRAVPSESVAQMKISLALPETDSFGKETLVRIRQSVGADDVVSGSYIPVGDDQIRLDLRLQDAVAGETLAAVSAKGPAAKLDEVVSQAGAELRAKLGLGGLSESQSADVKVSLPSNPEAARLYAEGLAKLRVFDALGARDLLQKAVALEPNFSLSHGALATAWRSLGYDARAKEESQKAFARSSKLPREERLSVEARYRETTNDWDKAVEIYRSLFSFFPDNLEYGLQLARTQASAGKGQEALSTIALLRKFPPPQRDDPRIDLAEGVAARSLGDFRRFEASAAQAAAKGQAQGSRLVVAQARTDQCVALRHLGKPKDSIAACEEAQGIYASAGSKRGVAMALNNIANSYYDQGDLAGAKNIYEQALATYREIGDQRGIAGALDNIASVSGDMGDTAGARKLSEQSLKIYREIGDYTGMAETLNNIGAAQVLEGDFGAAAKSFQQALDIWRKIGDKTGMATALTNLGDMLLGQGELAEAKLHYQEAFSTFHDSGQKGKSAYPLSGLAQVLSAEGDLEAAKGKYRDVLAICRETNDKHEWAYALFGMASVIERQGDLVTARHRHEEALAIRKEIGEKGTEAESLLALADLTIEEGHPEDGEALARKALNEFQTEKLKDDEVMAHSVLARSLLAQHKLAEARKQIDLAAGLAARSPVVEARLDYAIAAARVKGATGSVGEAVKSIEAALAEAGKHGYVAYQYEARFALGELEMRSGSIRAGRMRLNALEKDARAKGFLLIARKAAAASTAPS